MREMIIYLQTKLQTSGYILLLANLVPLLGVLFYNWQTLDVLLVYWLESCVIAFYNVLKILTVEMEDYQEFWILTIIIKIFFSTIFLIHFGAMVVLFGAMIYIAVSIFGKRDFDILQVLIKSWSAILALFMSHGYSFYKNYIKGGERKNSTIRLLMIQPYIRLMGLFFIIVVGITGGSIILVQYGEVLFFVILFILTKIVLDVIGHIVERKNFNLARKIDKGVGVLMNPAKTMDFMFRKIINKDRE
jgi:hypothetical protein